MEDTNYTKRFNGLSKSLDKYIKEKNSQDSCSGFIDGFKDRQNSTIEYIQLLERGDFTGWSTEEKSGYRTALISIKEFLNK